MQLVKTSVIDLQVIGANGHIVKSMHNGTMDIRTYTMPLNAGNLATDTYVVRLVADKVRFIKKVIK